MTKKLANDFKDFFKHKIDSIRQDIDKSIDHDSEISSDGNANLPTFSKFECFDPVSSEELLLIIKSLPNKFSILDPIPNWLLEECFIELSNVLLYIVNKSLSEGKFPQILKDAIVYPVVKDSSGDHDNLKNYRPISNLSVLSKILEKVVHSKLNKYLIENNLYCDVQSGYRTGHSCETLLVKMSDDIIKSIDHKNLVAVVLLDLSAAFDVLDHNLLLGKLKSLYGIDGIALKWFDSFLKNRSFSVKVNNETSCLGIVIYGVPQGSILGPLLFILYTKELSDIVASFGLNLQMYADDGSIYVQFNPRDPGNISSTLQNISLCLRQVKKWMLANYLKVNEGKTDFFIIGHGSTLREYSMKFDIDFCGTKITSKRLSEPGNSDFGKILGVLLNNDFSMNRHILNIKKDCYNQLRNLRNIKQYLTTEDKLALIKTLILSKMDFCNALYMNIPKYQLNILHKVINVCLRFVYNLGYQENVDEYYLKSHILPIEYRIKFKVILLIHKTLYSKGPKYLEELLNCNTPHWFGSGLGLRSSIDFSLLSVQHNARTSNFAKRRFHIHAPVEWNCIPSDIRNCVDCDKFKALLKTFLFQKYEQALSL